MDWQTNGCISIRGPLLTVMEVSDVIRREQPQNPRRGSALVESTLVLLVSLALFIGIGDLAQVLFVHQSLVERVREGLRYGVITYDTYAIQNIVLYGTPTPAN